jgi:hypothetical protein
LLQLWRETGGGVGDRHGGWLERRENKRGGERVRRRVADGEIKEMKESQTHSSH